MTSFLVGDADEENECGLLLVIALVDGRKQCGRVAMGKDANGGG